MQWWNGFVDWLGSPAGSRVFTSAIIPFVAIIVAGLLAAWIGRGFARRVVDHQQGELKAAAIMALIGAGRKAAIWTTLGFDERQHVDSLISEADIRVRLLPMNGASAAADWASHELASMKTNSATFSFQADQTFVDYRDRLLEWQNKPRRARKLFAFDLDRWRYDDDAAAQADSAGETPDDSTPAPTTGPEAMADTAPVTSAVPVTGAVPASSDAEALASAPPPTRGTSVPVASAPTSPASSSSFAPHTERPPRQDPPGLDSPADTTEIVYGRAGDDAFDAAVDDAESSDSYAPPVTAGTVRRRIEPDRHED